MGAAAREIRAAGGVVWRRRGGGAELLLVHRPRYDDWSFPKGKARKGEDDLAAALREVAEETGQRCTPGERLPDLRYEVRGRPKRVAYFLMEAEGGSFEPGSEVDRVEWVAVEEAGARLSYERDRELMPEILRRLVGEEP
jgi:8-oxo-dGTP diphosphatase